MVSSTFRESLPRITYLGPVLHGQVRIYVLLDAADGCCDGLYVYPPAYIFDQFARRKHRCASDDIGILSHELAPRSQIDNTYL